VKGHGRPQVGQNAHTSKPEVRSVNQIKLI